MLIEKQCPAQTIIYTCQVNRQIRVKGGSSNFASNFDSKSHNENMYVLSFQLIGPQFYCKQPQQITLTLKCTNFTP